MGGKQGERKKLGQEVKRRQCPYNDLCRHMCNNVLMMICEQNYNNVLTMMCTNQTFGGFYHTPNMHRFGYFSHILLLVLGFWEAPLSKAPCVFGGCPFGGGVNACLGGWVLVSMFK